MTDARHIPGNSLPRNLARIVGLCCLVFAGLGILYAQWYAVRVYTRYTFDPKVPYFLATYTTLLVFTLAVYAALIDCGVQLVRLRTSACKVLLLVVIAEVGMFFSIGCLWGAVAPGIVSSAAAAVGVGLGGLAPQFVVLFPIWGPALAIWSHRRIERRPEQRRMKGLCPHCGYDLKHEVKTCPECGLSPMNRTSSVD